LTWWRAVPDWTERELPAGLEQALWKRLKGARLFLRGAPTGIALVREPGVKAENVIEAKPGPRVEVAGSPAELTLWSMGRARAAHVTLRGQDEAVARLAAWRR
jgi:hypothetical protein